MKHFAFHPSSFRDDSGYIYKKDHQIFRTISLSYKDNYDLLVDSGLYSELTAKGLLIKHEEIESLKDSFTPKIYKIIKPDLVPVVSYPYEWSPNMLFEAARLTLTIETTALKYGLTLKDASAFNIQFIGPKPVFIDTLSFEKVDPKVPWIAYRQFCQHFLAPLALMKYKDLRLGKLSQLFLDGINLNLAVKFLPLRSFLNFHLFLNIFLHQKGQNFLQNKTEFADKKSFSQKNLHNLISSLEIALDSLKIKIQKSTWSDYYRENNYSNAAFQSKKNIITSILKGLKSRLVLDLGANTGLFSRIAAKFAKYSVSLDSDPQSVNVNFEMAKREKIANLLPLVVDLTNPTPSLGWKNQERSSIFERCDPDCVLALALIHHLYFGNNLTFENIAVFLSNLAKNLLIEFVPPKDDQIAKIKGLRSHNFNLYQEKNFLFAFCHYFKVVDRFNIQNSGRIIFHFKKR